MSAVKFILPQDSVAHVCFTHDGTLLASGDLAGYIQVWKVATLTKIWEFEVEDLAVCLLSNTSLHNDNYSLFLLLNTVLSRKVHSICKWSPPQHLNE